MTKNDDIGTTFAIAVGVSMYQSFAIVAALAEARLLDPLKVAAWAETFAGGLGQNLPPDIAASMSEQLHNFSSLVVAMATKPEMSGRG